MQYHACMGHVLVPGPNLTDWPSSCNIHSLSVNCTEKKEKKKKIWACYCAHEEVNDIRGLFFAIFGRALDCNWASEFSDGSRSRTY